MVKPIYTDEYVQRVTISPEIMEDPERLLTMVTVKSLTTMHEGQKRHYKGYGVSAVAPLYDVDGNPKLLAASNYRPYPAEEDRPVDIRPCAEQALIDNSVHEGDASPGVLFVRGPKPNPEKPIIGCREGAKTLHLCRPCRGRMLEFIGPELLIVSFVDEDPEPTEAMTLAQMLNFHDIGGKYPALPKGKSARDVALDALANIKDIKPVKKPLRPRRTLRSSERDC